MFTPPPAETVAPPSPSPEQRQAGIGDTITLASSETTLDVTVLSTASRTNASGGFLKPDPGNRYFAVRLRITNRGSEVYDDSPSNGSKVVDAEDQQYDASFFDAVEPGMGSVKLGPGKSRVGYITFEIPKAAKPVSFQFTPNSGFADETGEWSLG